MIGVIMLRCRPTALLARAFLSRACRGVCRGGSVTASCWPPAGSSVPRMSSSVPRSEVKVSVSRSSRSASA